MSRLIPILTHAQITYLPYMVRSSLDTIRFSRPVLQIAVCSQSLNAAISSASHYQLFINTSLKEACCSDHTQWVVHLESWNTTSLTYSCNSFGKSVVSNWWFCVQHGSFGFFRGVRYSTGSSAFGHSYKCFLYMWTRRRCGFLTLAWWTTHFGCTFLWEIPPAFFFLIFRVYEVGWGIRRLK